nr:unnamed protein product [Callosobruchus analis]
MLFQHDFPLLYLTSANSKTTVAPRPSSLYLSERTVVEP